MSVARRLGATLATLLCCATVAAQHPVASEGDTPDDTAVSAADDGVYAPEVAQASDEWRAARDAITSAPGIEVELFAAEPHLANPVCLWVDGRGAVYVGETFRHHAGVTDIREHWDWLDADLAARTVADRLAYMAEFEGETFADYATEHDRIRLVRDTDGDGRADTSTVFADGFDDPAAGIGAGLIERDGWVYYTCIPDLWRLRDDDGDGVADQRQLLSTGYGVHTGLLGHDLHGLRFGPDGRLYFSLGDRAAHVETDAGVLDHTHTGGVFRCEPDGSDLQLFHTGLRNPQELAFDAYGNLWTGDNNSDGGDEARWVRCLPGADSGWRFSYQWIDDPVTRGPWNDEQLWHPKHAGQAAYLVPPVANIANGPSGLAVHPGTGLSDAYAGHFFLCDFGGGQQWSGVWTFAVEPVGASYRMVRKRKFLWDTLVTDCDFGPDGALWFSDWVSGWNKTGKGRVFRALDPASADSPLLRETAALLAGGTADASIDELAARLSHADQRVRQAAQFALAERGEPGARALVEAAEHGATLMARLHGVWGLWIVGRRDPAWLAPLLPLSRSMHPELRAQCLQVLGDLAHAPAAEVVRIGLVDESPRVRLFAALAAGRLALPAAREPLLDIVRAAGDDDRDLRHAAVMGLLGTGDDLSLLRHWADESPHVRTAIVLALRRRGSPLLASALTEAAADSRSDEAPWLALEIARAIHDDVPVPSAYPTLAALLAEPAGPGLLTRFLAAATGADEVGQDADDANGDNDASQDGDSPDDTDAAATTNAKSPTADLPPLATAAFVRRLLAANLHLGGELHARRVAALALRDDAPDDLRVEALQLLAAWEQPGSRDLVMGDWRPFEPRDVSFLPRVLQQLVDADLAAAPAAVRVAFCELLADLGAAERADLLAAWARDGEAPSSVRVAALDALALLAAEPLADVVELALSDPDGALRAAALAALPGMDPAQAWRWLPAIVADGELAERRVAYELLGEAEGFPADEVAALLRSELDLLERGLRPPELALELVTAARARGLDAPRHGGASELAPELAPWLDCLQGGDARAGREVFRRATLACQRCHSTDEDTGLRVGPDLEGVGGRLARLQILASIVDPNRRFAPGYATTNVFLTDGAVLSGRLLAEDAEDLSLLDADGVVHELALDDIELRRAGLSAMPEDLVAALTPHELRDLVEYLAQL